MPVDVTVEEEIARPRETVAAFATDPANDTRWIKALSHARKLTDGPVAPGTRVERIASFLGREIVYVNEVVAFEPGRRHAHAHPHRRGRIGLLRDGGAGARCDGAPRRGPRPGRAQVTPGGRRRSSRSFSR